MTVEPWQWGFFGILLLGALGLIWAIFREQKHNKNIRAFLRLIFGEEVQRKDLEEKWMSLTTKERHSLVRGLPSAFRHQAKDEDDMLIVLKIVETLEMGALVRTAIIRESALLFPESENVYSMAISHWGTLPDDLLETLALADVSRIRILAEDFAEKPGVRDRIAKNLAKSGNMEALQALYVGTAPPEDLVKQCATASLPTSASPQ